MSGPGSATADAPRESPPDGGSSDLRARSAEIIERRGRGRPKGSSNKSGSSEKKTAPAAAPAKTPEFVYSKVGKAFRSVFNLLAVKTDCTCWLLAADEEKDLGEAFGDLLLDVGVVDSTIVKSIFAAGSLIAVGSTKAVIYAGYRASLAAKAPGAAPRPHAPAAPPVADDPVAAKVIDGSMIPDNSGSDGKTI